MSFDGSLKFDTAIDISGFSAGAASIGKIAATAVTAVAGAMSAMSVAAVKVGSDFEVGMSQVVAISGATNEELNALTDKAAEMGAKTKFSATQSAEALNYMAMAGWKTEQMLDGLPAVMNLAAASGENLGTVSDIVTDAMTAFGLQAEKSGHFADVLATASSNANTNVSTMGQTFKYAAPIAGALGYSIEDTALAIGLMANAGIKGEQAGTQLRAMFSRLVNPPKEAAEAIEILGIEVTNIDGSMKPLKDTLSILRDSFENLTDSEKASYASMLAGQEAMSGLLTLVNASEDDFNKLSEAIANADGSAEDMAETMNDNLKGKITILQSALEGLGITVYDSFANPMKSAVESATKQIDRLNNSIKNGKLSDSVSKIAAAFSKTAESILGVVADKVLPALIDGFAWVVDNGNTIKSVLLGLTTATIAYKTATFLTQGTIAQLKAIEEGANIVELARNGTLKLSTIAYQRATGALTAYKAQTLAATTTTAAFNVALNANVIGLVVAAVVALGTAIYSLSQSTEIASNKIKQLDKELDQVRETSKKSVSDTEAEIDLIKTKASQYENLLDVYNRTGEGYGQLKIVAEEFQSLLPSEISLINEETGAYRSLGNEIELTTEKMRARAQLSGVNDELTEAYRQLREYTKMHDEAVNGYRSAQDNYKNARFYGAGTPVDLERNDYIKEIDSQADKVYNYADKIYDISYLITQLENESTEILEASAKKELQISEQKNQKIAEQAKKGAEQKYNITSDAYSKQHSLDMEYQKRTIEESIKTFEEEKEILDRARKRSLISDSEYYNELERLLSEHHISDIGDNQRYYDELIVGRNQLNETLIQNQESANRKLEQEQERSLKEQQKLQETEFKEWSENADKIVDEYNKKCSNIVSQRESMQSRLASFGSLFTIEKDEENDKEIVKLQNLQEQTEQLIHYSEQLNKLREKGASSDFLNEMAGMDIEKATQFMDKLLESGQIEDYLKAYEDKQKAAAEIAKQFYDSQLETIQTEFADKIQDVFEAVPEDMSLVGENTVQGFLDGIDAKLQEIANKGFEVGNTFAEALKKSLDIHSPSRVTMQLGDYTGQGFLLGLNGYKGQVYKSAAEIAGGVTAGLKNTDISGISNKIRLVSHTDIPLSPAVSSTAGAGGQSVDDNSSHTYNVTIDAHSVKDFTDVVNVCKNAQQKARAR